MKSFWNTFLASNDTLYRLARTILQGIIATIVAYIDVIVGLMTIPNELRPMIVALVMAILSPIMSELGKSVKTDDNPNRDTLERTGGYDNDDRSEA